MPRSRRFLACLASYHSNCTFVRVRLKRTSLKSGQPDQHGLYPKFVSWSASSWAVRSVAKGQRWTTAGTIQSRERLNTAVISSPRRRVSACEFTDRRERGYDVVEDRITCLKSDANVECKLRPGAGPGPDQNWMNYACGRVSHVCQITRGNLGFTAGYTALFEGHNAGLQSESALAAAESRY